MLRTTKVKVNDLPSPSFFLLLPFQHPLGTPEAQSAYPILLLLQDESVAPGEVLMLPPHPQAEFGALDSLGSAGGGLINDGLGDGGGQEVCLVGGGHSDFPHVYF